LPTFAESGYPQLNRPGWAAIFSPAATPADIVKKMSNECQRVGQQADVVDKGAALGFEVSNMNTEEFKTYVREDYQAWGQMIRLTGVKMG
jgi:tripartite-type tricarboxylate transporter receptor subunit TctC